MDAASTPPVLGLFGEHHMDWGIDRDPAVQPSIKEMSLKVHSLSILCCMCYPRICSEQNEPTVGLTKNALPDCTILVGIELAAIDIVLPPVSYSSHTCLLLLLCSASTLFLNI